MQLLRSLDRSWLRQPVTCYHWAEWPAGSTAVHQTLMNNYIPRYPWFPSWVGNGSASPRVSFLEEEVFLNFFIKGCKGSSSSVSPWDSAITSVSVSPSVSPTSGAPSDALGVTTPALQTHTYAYTHIHDTSLAGVSSTCALVSVWMDSMCECTDAHPNHPDIHLLMFANLWLKLKCCTSPPSPNQLCVVGTYSKHTGKYGTYRCTIFSPCREGN